MIDRLAELLGIAEDEDGKDENAAEAGPSIIPGRRGAAPVPASEGPPEPPENQAAPNEEQGEPVPAELERAVREEENLREEWGRAKSRPDSGGMEDPFPALTGEEGPALSAGKPVPDGAARPPAPDGGEERPGLGPLYQEIRRTAESAAGKKLPEPAPPPSARLTVEELDRAMRRDSRRYDGGMTIY